MSIASDIKRIEDRVERIGQKLDALLTLFQVPLSKISSPDRTNEPPLAAVTKNESPTQKSVQKQFLHLIFANSAQHEQQKFHDKLFIHKPLESASKEIRLFEFVSQPGFPIRCQLDHVPFNQEDFDVEPRLKPYYQTLSYTWGNLAKTDFIILNGYRFLVTKDLLSALSKMQTTGPKSKWWVDTICINQADTNERNQQVSLMRTIYKESTGVLIWLGEEADDSSLAISTINSLQVSLQKSAPGRLVQPKPVTDEEKLRKWRALWAFYQRPWFSRVWVRQEQVLSALGQVHCGPHWTTFQEIADAARDMQSVCDGFEYNPLPLIRNQNLLIPPYYHSQLIHQIGRWSEQGQKFVNPLDLLIATRGCDSTVPHDKIYSVLGLVDASQYPIIVDYKSSLVDVCTTVIHLIINKSQSLECLNIAQNANREFGLPSWIPNFATKWKRNPLPEVASYGAYWNEEIKSLKFTEGQLCVEGDYISDIERICGTGPLNSDDNHQLAVLLTQWRAFIDNAPDIIYQCSSSGSTS
jgi:hypothetical protein